MSHIYCIATLVCIYITTLFGCASNPNPPTAHSPPPNAQCVTTTWTQTQSPFAHEPLISITFADFNQDGIEDAFLANHGPNTVYFGTQDGSWKPSKQTLGDDQSFQAIAHDFNQDGHLDVFVANLHEDTLYLGSHNGSLSHAQSFPNPFRLRNKHPYATTLQDLNNDDILDIRVQNARPFHPQKTYQTDYIVHRDKPWQTQYIETSHHQPEPLHKHSTDFDQDGRNDHIHNDVITWNTTQGPLQHPAPLPGPRGPILTRTIRDFNQDGLPDILTTRAVTRHGRPAVNFDPHNGRDGVHKPSLTHSLLLNTPNQPALCTFAQHQTDLDTNFKPLPPEYDNIPEDSKSNIQSAYRPAIDRVLSYDANRDQLPDLLITTDQGLLIWYATPQGWAPKPTLSLPPILPLPSWPVTKGHPIAVGDLNGDTHDDLILLHPLSDTFTPLEFNNGAWNVERHIPPLPLAHTIFLKHPTSNQPLYNAYTPTDTYTTYSHTQGPQYHHGTFAHIAPPSPNTPQRLILSDTRTLYTCTNLLQPTQTCASFPIQPSPTPHTETPQEWIHLRSEEPTPEGWIYKDIPMTTWDLLHNAANIIATPPQRETSQSLPHPHTRLPFSAKLRYTDHTKETLETYTYDTDLIQHIAGDFNGDTYTDLLIVYSEAPPLLLQGSSDPASYTPTRLITHTTPRLERIRRILIEDLNNDSHPDLLINTEKGTTIHLTTPSIQTLPQLIQTPPTHTFDYTLNLIEDLNNDSYPDLILSKHCETHILLNRGNASFHPPRILHTSSCSPHIATHDLNNDSYPDLIAQNNDRTLSIWHTIPTP